ncbi:hypothetical protein BFW01_g12889 [Lasiodiplodia theobromae]|nr:hypothetical protein BFW01_g12889 [Lasiodiplodia theobromae]
MPPVHANNEAALLELWGEYGFGVLIFALRYFVRIRMVGFGGFLGDDYFGFIAVICLTIDGIVVDHATRHGTAVEFTEDQLNEMTIAEVRSIGIGSKFEFIGWFSYPGLIWSMKAMMLFFYRLTFRLWQRKLLIILCLLVAASWIAVLFTVCFSCPSFPDNWKVRPRPSLNCTFHPQNVAIVSFGNIFTDLAVLSIPIPLFWTLKRPLKQKIFMGCFLLGGILAITVAVIRVVITLGSHPSTLNINLWGTRETTVALLCVNAPVLRALFTRSFWTAQPLPTELSTGGSGRYGSTTGSRHHHITIDSEYTDPINRPNRFPLPAVVEGSSKEGRNRSDSTQTIPVDMDSEHHMMMRDSRQHVIVAQVEVQVEREERSGRESRRGDIEMGSADWAKGW